MDIYIFITKTIFVFYSYTRPLRVSTTIDIMFTGRQTTPSKGLPGTPSTTEQTYAVPIFNPFIPLAPTISHTVINTRHSLNTVTITFKCGSEDDHLRNMRGFAFPTTNHQTHTSQINNSHITLPHQPSQIILLTTKYRGSKHNCDTTTTINTTTTTALENHRLFWTNTVW